MKNKSFPIFMITLLLITMAFSSFSVFAASPSTWAEAEVDEARNKGLVLSEADDNFQNDITRELFCKLVVNLVEQATEDPVSITTTNPFQDTNNSDIIKAYQLGIVNGMSATEFGPDLLITREQVAAMMMRSARKLDELMNQNYTMMQLVGEADFADLNEISDWALQDIREANALGIMKGVGDNKIDPKGNTTIEQSILLILRVFNEYLADEDNNGSSMGDDNEMPIALQTTSFTVDEGQIIEFSTIEVASDPDGDNLMFTAFELNEAMTSEIGEGLIFRTSSVENPNFFRFTADLVSEDMYTIYDMTISDGTDEIVIPIRIEINEVNNPPVGNDIITLHQDEGSGKIYFGLDVATDPDGDTLLVTDFALSEENLWDIGTGEIRDFDGAEYFYFTADNLDLAKLILFDLTVTDGIHEVIVPIRIQVDNVSDPPVGNPLTTLHQDEGTGKIYFGLDVATDPEGDTLEITDFAVSEQNQWDIGTPEIRDFDGVEYFYFTADNVDLAKWTYYDLTVTDGVEDVIVTIRIQVDNVD